MRQSLGLRPEQAIEAIWVITQNLSRQFVWLVFWVLHLALLTAAVLLLWAFQITPAAAARSLSEALSTSLVAAAGLLGVSVLGILGAYLSIARKVWARTYARWHTDQLMQGLVTR